MRKRYIALIIILIMIIIIGGVVVYALDKCANDSDSDKGILCDVFGWFIST